MPSFSTANAYYGADVATFSSAAPEEILGGITAKSAFAVDPAQRDAVLISGPAVFPIEFKVGETEFKRDGLNQVWDYALDLKNFHKASHHAPVVPILVATHASRSDIVLPSPHSDGVFAPVCCNSAG